MGVATVVVVVVLVYFSIYMCVWANHVCLDMIYISKQIYTVDVIPSLNTSVVLSNISIYSRPLDEGVSVDLSFFFFAP